MSTSRPEPSPASRRLARWRNLLIGVLLSAFFLWIALRDLDWAGVGAVLREAQWGFVPLTMVIWSLGLAARALRWRVMLGGGPAFAPTFHILNIGFTVNNTLPFRIGELARAYLIGRGERGVSVWSALSTIVAERIIDMLTVVVLLGAVLPVLPVDQAAVTGGLALGAVAVVGFAVLLIFAHRPDWAHALLGLALRFAPFARRLNPASLLDRVLDGLQPLTTRRGLLGTGLWTALAWACSVAGAWSLARVFPELPQTPVMQAGLTLAIVAASFSIIIPFTLASVGPFEAATIFALTTAG
ncbi:MAG: flippase-like domain-containing protein, partial [Anaerolineae bacterium]|nr:flippase-like domain-containing protein [Anaerolineae bacterium]